MFNLDELTVTLRQKDLPSLSIDLIKFYPYLHLFDL